MPWLRSYRTFHCCGPRCPWPNGAGMCSPASRAGSGRAARELAGSRHHRTGSHPRLVEPGGVQHWDRLRAVGPGRHRPRRPARHRGTPSAEGRSNVSGADVLAALCDEHGQPYPLPTYAVDTPSGGCHLYYAAPGWAGTELRRAARPAHRRPRRRRVRDRRRQPDRQRAYTARDQRAPARCRSGSPRCLRTARRGGQGVPSGPARRVRERLRDGRAARRDPAGRHRPAGDPQ